MFIAFVDPLTKMLIDALRADATRHEQGDFGNVGCEFETVEAYRSQYLLDSPSNKNIGIAHTFWDSWIDQVRHGFGQNFYDGIPPNTWPSMAKEIIQSLESGTPIANTTVLLHFDLARR